MGSYQVPRVTDRDPPHLAVLFWAFLLLATGFAIWRTTIVNWHVWYGPLSWVVETFGTATTILFILTLRRTSRTPPRYAAVPTSKTVDILIPTANEPLAVLEPTVIGALRVRGVRDVLVLDDGVRREVREMAHRLGARYLPRASNEGAKAGNMNHGLLATDAELIVTLDADHIPLPEFIERTVGYFDDPDVALVQTPQSFYNTDSFTFQRRGGVETGWHEQEMFYYGIQPAKNSTNSTMFTGTSAMLRRSALDSIGGFAPDTPTEDVHTSLRLHAKGFKSVYVETPLAYGLEVDNLQEYFRTRRRWAAGSLRLLLRHPDSPLRARGLTLSQRLNYLSATMTHLRGINRLLYLVTPIAAVATGVSPVQGPFWAYGFFFLAFMTFSVWTVSKFGRGHYHIAYNEAFGIADALPMIAAVRAVFGQERKFGVTRKRTTRSTDRGLTYAHRAFVGAYVLALAFTIVRLGTVQHVAIAAWAGAFLTIDSIFAVMFLVAIERYERSLATPWYLRLGPAELYHRVVARAARRELSTPSVDRVSA